MTPPPDEIIENVGTDTSYYAGSHVFLPVSKLVGLPVDHVNFFGMRGLHIFCVRVFLLHSLTFPQELSVTLFLNPHILFLSQSVFLPK